MKSKRIDIQFEIDEDKNIFSNTNIDSIEDAIKMALLIKGIMFDSFKIVENVRQEFEYEAK